MKKFILGATLGALVSVSGSAFAYQYVDGHRTVAAQDASGNPVVVIGGEARPVVSNPSTEAEKSDRAAYLQAQLDDLLASEQAFQASECDK